MLNGSNCALNHAAQLNSYSKAVLEHFGINNLV